MLKKYICIYTFLAESLLFQPNYSHAYYGPWEAWTPLLWSMEFSLYLDLNGYATWGGEKSRLRSKNYERFRGNVSTILGKGGNHLSRHCFPMRPGKSFAISDHFLSPSFSTILMIRSSSCEKTVVILCHPCRKIVWMIESDLSPFGHTSLVQSPLTRSGSTTFCQRCRHWTSVLPVRHSAAKNNKSVKTTFVLRRGELSRI